MLACVDKIVVSLLTEKLPGNRKDLDFTAVPARSRNSLF